MKLENRSTLFLCLKNPVKVGSGIFIHRFGSSHNAHPNFNCVITKGD